MHSTIWKVKRASDFPHFSTQWAHMVDRMPETGDGAPEPFCCHTSCMLLGIWASHPAEDDSGV